MRLDINNITYLQARLLPGTNSQPSAALYLVALRADRCIHIGLDFGLGEGAVVNANLVNAPLEKFAPQYYFHQFVAVPSKWRSLPTIARTSHLHAIDEQTQCRAVVGARQMRPDVVAQAAPYLRRRLAPRAQRRARLLVGTLVSCSIEIVNCQHQDAP